MSAPGDKEFRDHGVVVGIWRADAAVGDRAQVAAVKNVVDMEIETVGVVGRERYFACFAKGCLEIIATQLAHCIAAGNIVEVAGDVHVLREAAISPA